MFSFSQRSLDNLEGVHADLVKVCKRAIELTEVDFGITEGLRTGERQHDLYLEGATQIDYPPPHGVRTPPHLLGKAVDFMAYVDGHGTWDSEYYPRIADAFKAAAAELKIPIHWGGDNPKWKDPDHVELDHSAYPDEPVVA